MCQGLTKFNVKWPRFKHLWYSDVTFFLFYKKKRRKKLVVSKYFIIFVIKNF